MRLLNCRTVSFEVFHNETPTYAILSHTWEEEEVLLQDVTNNAAAQKAGYEKFRAFCAQAARDGFNYAWMDTCCIDKTDPVEVQESINSMFKWYRGARKCYAYLSDYTNAGSSATLDLAQLQASRWFTRGWTLQKLLAPGNVVFYDRKWDCIGSKTELKDSISLITYVSKQVLEGQDLADSSVAQRMSWASRRETTRPEDLAYCLIGIFGVSLSPIYGEGADMAFLRLQKAIMEQSDDHTIFAWKQQDGLSGHGLLTSSPSSFKDSGYIVQADDQGARNSYGMTNRGLRIQLPLSCHIRGGDFVADLRCLDSRHQERIGLHLTSMRDYRFTRVRLDEISNLKDLTYQGYMRFEMHDIYVPQRQLIEPPSARQFNFHVREAAHDTMTRVHSYIAKPVRLATNKLTNIVFSPAIVFFPPPNSFTTTSFGSPDSETGLRGFDTTLGIGGLGAVFFTGAKGAMSQMWKLHPRDRTGNLPLRALVVVVFGVSLVGNAYTDISCVLIGTDETAQSQEFEDFLLTYQIKAESGKSAQLKVGSVVFKANITEKSLVHDQSTFEVSICYAERLV